MSRKSLLRIASIGLALVSLAFAATASAQQGPYSQQTLRVLGPSGLPAVNHCLIVGDSGRATVPSRHAWSDPYYELGGTCGLPSKGFLLDNGQAVWSIGCNVGGECIIENYRLRADGVTVVKCLQANVKTNQVSLKDGSCIHYIGNKPFAAPESFWLVRQDSVLTNLRPINDPGKCMIFSNRGHDRVPTLYRWGSVAADTEWCGLGSRDAVFETGQALFVAESVGKPDYIIKANRSSKR